MNRGFIARREKYNPPVASDLAGENKRTSRHDFETLSETLIDSREYAQCPASVYLWNLTSMEVIDLAVKNGDAVVPVGCTRV